MSARTQRILLSVSETLRLIGSGLAGVVPALRAGDGTFGTQRARAEQLAERRRAEFPSD